MNNAKKIVLLILSLSLLSCALSSCMRRDERREIYQGETDRRELFGFLGGSREEATEKPEERKEITENAKKHEDADSILGFYLLSDDTYSVRAKSNAKNTEIIVIPDTYMDKPVTSILSGAFSACSELDVIIIPSTIKTISLSAFSSCPKLSMVCYEGTESDWENIKILDYEYYNFYKLDRILLFYDDTVNAKTGTHWKYIDGVPTKY